MASSPAPPRSPCAILGVYRGSTVRLVQCVAGMDPDELRAVLAAAFGPFEADATIAGLVSAEGLCSPLSLVCGAPSYFGGRREPFGLLVTRVARPERPPGDAAAAAVTTVVTDGHGDRVGGAHNKDEATIDGVAAPPERHEPASSSSSDAHHRRRIPKRPFGEILAEDAAFRRRYGDDAFDLHGLDLRETCAVFWAASKPAGPWGASATLDASAYAAAARACLAHVGDGVVSRYAEVLSRAWMAFAEASKSGAAVDAAAFLVGLSTLCGGSRELKLSESFALFDFNGDGVITLDEMTRYFYAVFLVARERDPRGVLELYRRGFVADAEDGDDAYSVEESHAADGVSLASLAAATAESCFTAADADHDGTLTFDEFAAWATPSNAATTANVAQDVEYYTATQCRAILGLDECDGARARRAVMRRADSRGLVSRTAFVGLCVEGELGSEAAPTEETRRLRLDVATRLFDRLLQSPEGHDDRTGRVAADRLAAGLAAVCGRVEERDAHRSLFDAHGGSVSRDELAAYFDAVFTVLCACSRDHADVDAARLARATADNCFRDILGVEDDEVRGPRIPYGEFRAWCDEAASGREAAAAPGTTTTTTTTPAQTQHAGVEDRLAASAVRAATCLDAFSLAEVAASFQATLARLRAEAVTVDALRHCFLDLRRAFAARRGLAYDAAVDAQTFDEAPGRADDDSATQKKTGAVAASSLCLRVHRALRPTPDAPSASLRETLLGLSVLCRDVGKDRLVFDLISRDGHVVDRDDLEGYLRAFFRVVRALDDGSSSAASHGGEDGAPASSAWPYGTDDPTTLARLAARRALRDGAEQLTLDEFRAWYHRDDDDDDDDTLPVGGVQQHDPAPRAARPTRGKKSETRLQRAARVADLRSIDAARAVSALAARADRDGRLDRPAFVDALSAFLHHVDPDARTAALDDVFDVIRTKTSSHVAQRVPGDCVRRAPSIK